jgi:hypothetical protein
MTLKRKASSERSTKSPKVSEEESIRGSKEKLIEGNY